MPQGGIKSVLISNFSVISVLFLSSTDFVLITKKGFQCYSRQQQKNSIVLFV